MTDVLIVGDGPCGLTAALFLAKNDVDVHVFGEDDTAMHSAYLYNYPGIEEMHGSKWVERVRNQVDGVGATLHDTAVDRIEADDGFTVHTGNGKEFSGTYLVLAHGADRSLAEEIGVAFDGNVVETDKRGRTSMENVYAGGWVARDQQVQAVISAGDGAAIALDILSAITGEDGFHDFDVPA